MELPPNVLSTLKASAVRVHTLVMSEMEGNVTNTNNLTRMTVTKKFDEVGSIQSRAVHKVLALPPA